MENEETVKTGSEPVKTDEAKTDVKVDPSTTTDVKEAKSSDAEVPWHKDPRFKNDLKLLKTAKSVMESNDLEDIDDLVELINSGKKVHGKQVDLDHLDEIAKKAETLDKYQKYWAQQEELKRRDGERPEETIARLQRQNEEISGKFAQKEASEAEVREAKKAVAFYETEVQSLIENEVENLSAPEKKFIAWSLGVGNDCNEITITDKKQIKKVIGNGVKKYNEIVKTIKEGAIKEYLAGKTSIPNVLSTDGTVATTKVEPIKGLKNLRKAFQDSVLPQK